MLTARTEITDRMLVFGQRHMRTIMAQYGAPLRRIEAQAGTSGRVLEPHTLPMDNDPF